MPKLRPPKLRLPQLPLKGGTVRPGRTVRTPNPLTQALNLKASGIFRLLVITTALLGGTIALGAASATMLQGLYSSWQLARAGSLTVYLPPEADATALAQLADSLPTLQGVTAVRPVSQQEVRGWIAPLAQDTISTTATGTPLPGTLNLPLPTVIEVAFTETTSPTALTAHIRQAFPTAEVDDHKPMLNDVASGVRGLQLALGSLALAMLVLMTLLISLTTRTGLLSQSTTLHLLTQLGATDSVLVRSVCTQVLARTLVGYALGLAGATGLLSLATFIMPAVSAHLTPAVWAALILSPLLLPALALLTAALTTRHMLHRLTA